MNIGDYVRTDYSIGKIIEILQPTDVDEPDLKLDVSDCNDNPYIFKSEVIKSSPNIIDLIEVGDIVNYEQLNGGVVLNKKEDSIDTWSILPNSLKNKDIKSVITKEQLKNNMYVVGE